MPFSKLLTSRLPSRLGTITSRTGLLQCQTFMHPDIISRNLTVTLTARKNKDKDASELSTADESTSKDKPEPSAQDTSQKMVRTAYIDKKSLVWDKRYKSVDDVPEMLPYQTIVQARNRFRIRANLMMIALTILAAIVMVYTGKERAKTGDTVEKRTLERHRQLRAQKAEEDRAAAAAAGVDK